MFLPNVPLKLFFFFHSALHYPLPHFLRSQVMFFNTVTSPFFINWTLEVGLFVFNECCHVRFSHFGPQSYKFLHVLLNSCAYLCHCRNRSFQHFQGTGFWAKLFYISSALKKPVGEIHEIPEKNYGPVKHCCTILLAGCVCYSKQATGAKRS